MHCVIRCQAGFETLPTLEEYLADPRPFGKINVVYKDGKMSRLYTEDAELGTGETVKSVLGGKIKLRKNENFANVIGSTGDPLPSGYTSWIRLWSAQFGITPTICASYNFPSPISCSDDLVGGHCLLGKGPTRVSSGVDYVFIIPICKRHNANDSIYMKAIQYTQAVLLYDYYKK
eukprot:TRINITY_DN13131_c0_g1_i2.p1 TRINITY_DN13131_c0_g1~~TRINITY_DN13131_c0_g1_i2.p1  ORF type:complete len:175 (+),score=15.64 TRINITY_DN13131_c0_g1_i2:46-570(+)